MSGHVSYGPNPRFSGITAAEFCRRLPARDDPDRVAVVLTWQRQVLELSNKCWACDTILLPKDSMWICEESSIMVCGICWDELLGTRR